MPARKRVRRSKQLTYEESEAPQGAARTTHWGHATATSQARKAAVYKDEKFSVHAPITIEYAFVL